MVFCFLKHFGYDACMRHPRIVTIGGGTGNFTVLSGLKKYPVELTAVVSMADDGGSTGVLRDELGVLPPGDIRQCLVALAEAQRSVREVMSYRFTKGSLRGHTIGNLILSGLEQMTGSLEEAIQRAGGILSVRGAVVPSTYTKVKLCAELGTGRILSGQTKIADANLFMLKRMFLRPRATANPKAIQAILAAEYLIVGPGDFYSSLIPNFLVPGIAAAVRRSKARLVYVCNIMTKLNQTTNWTVKDFAGHMERYVRRRFDFVLYNTAYPPTKLIARYALEGEELVMPGGLEGRQKYIGAPLFGPHVSHSSKGDRLIRPLIRHDADKLASVIMRRIVRR